MTSRRHISTHRIICWRFTRHCNRRCTFCLSQSGPELAHPALDYRNIVRRLAATGVEKVSYTGGEPLLHPRLLETVRDVQQHGIRQVIVTNGTALREHMRVLDYLEYVKFSFYGCQDVHDSLVCNGDYAALLRLAGELSGQGYTIGANLMLSRLSLCAIEKCLSDFHRVGIRHVLMLSYVPTGRTAVDQIYRLDLSASTLERIRNAASSYVHAFEGGIKIHNYAIADCTALLDENCCLWLANYRGGPDFYMGGLFDEFIRMPHGQMDTIANVLGTIWDKRLHTEAIVTV